MKLIIYSAIMLIGVFISAIAQVLLKQATVKEHSSIFREYLNFQVILAYSLFVISTFVNIYSYKVVPLSMGPILEATSYIYITIFGITIFKEKITRMRMFALSLILIGIIIFSLG